MSCDDELTLCGLAGDTFQYRVLYTDSAGAAVNLTGYTVTFSVTSGGTTTDYTSGSGLTITAGSGQIDILIPDSDTEDWLANTTWVLKIESGSGIVTTLGRGRIDTT